MNVNFAIKEVILPMPFRPPFLLGFPCPGDALDDKFSIDLLDVVPVWFSVNLKALNELGSSFKDLSTKDARVNMEESEFIFPGLIRSREWIDCFDCNRGR